MSNNVEKAKAMRDQVEENGLKFTAFLPLDIGTFILDKVIKGDFTSPSEAVFHILKEYMDYEKHDDIRKEVFKRSLDDAYTDPAPTVPMEEVFAKLRNRKPPNPAIWDDK